MKKLKLFYNPFSGNKSFKFDLDVCIGIFQEGGYEVLAAFYSEIYPVDAEGVFRYYEYADLSDPERFTEYVEQAKAAALYDTGIAAQYGDRLLTLSTCSYHTDNGRFVVVARKAA